MSTNKKFVVYTVLTGDVHELVDPFPANCHGFDRICFTDDRGLNSSAWDVVTFRDHALEAGHEARRPKLLPHRYLAGYEWSLYVDNGLKFRIDPLKIWETYRGTGDFVGFRHPWRDCAYAEAEEVIRQGIDKECRVREQTDHYRRHGFPERNGLIAGTMLLRRHHAEPVVSVDEEWFDHVLRFSRRDQLSFNFVAWRQGFAYQTFQGELNNNPYMQWPCVSRDERVPADFDEAVYEWLNPAVAQSGMSPRKHFLVEGRKQGLRYRKPVRELNRLANKYKTDKGNLYFNAHGYADVYENYLRRFRDTSVRVLELGLLRHDVQARKPGGPYDDAPSLSMWREYLPKAEIVGFDIADFSAVPPIPGCRILRGDMSKPDDLLLAVEAAGGKFDVIIDDASHASHHQQIALGTLFEHLKQGGYYFIEDLHYQPPSLEDPRCIKTKELLLGWQRGITSPTDYLPADVQASIIKQIDFIHFYDSQDRAFGGLHPDVLAVIRKKGSGDALRRLAGVVPRSGIRKRLVVRLKGLLGRPGR